MKILIINTFYYPHEIGGAEKSVRILAEHLVKEGCEVTVLALSDNGEKKIDYINDVKIIRVPVMNLYNPGINKRKGGGFHRKLSKIIWHLCDYYNLASYLYLRKVINEPYDVIHTNNLSGFSVAAWDWARNKHIPIVHTSRDYYLFNPNCTMYSKGKNQDPSSYKIRLLSYYKKIMSRKVDAYVGISNFIHDLHMNSGFFSDVKHNKVIYNSIGGNLSERELNQGHRRDGKIRLGYLGRLDDAKGISVVIDYLKDSVFDFSFKIAGKGDEEFVEKLKNECVNDVRFIFLGQTKPEVLFNDIDCLICPSKWHEPMGRVVIEAFSYGIPVIGNNAGGIGELISPGYTGFLFDINSKESFIDALSSYDISDFNELSKNSIELSKKFTDERYVTAYKTLYQDLISESNIRT